MTFVLWQILAILSLATVANYVLFAVFNPSSKGYIALSVNERSFAAFVTLFVMVLCISLRSIYYGPDTQAYYQFFSQYCFGNAADLDFDYKASFFFLNAALLWGCNPNYLIPGWIFLFLIPFAFLEMSWVRRVQFFALSIVSFIGIELTTNIFRQGISASFMLLGFAWYKRKPWVAILSVAVSLALHSSGALVLLAIVLANLRWRYFLVGFSVLIGIVLIYSNTQTGIGFVDRFFYEMNKYGSIDDLEIYIRLLAVVQLCVPISFAWLSRRFAPIEERGDNRDWIVSVRLALTCLPFLTMPYFGYRYVYGLYLVVLFLNYRHIVSRRSLAFEGVFYTSLAISLAWAYGSTLVRTSPFLGL